MENEECNFPYEFLFNTDLRKWNIRYITMQFHVYNEYRRTKDKNKL